jgi:Putative porin
MFAQEPDLGLMRRDTTKTGLGKPPLVAPKAKHEQYKIYTVDRDTTYVDTSLTIQSEYKYNYLRKDIFGLQQFANEGQTYNKLYFGLNTYNPYPEFGFKSKQYGYLPVEDINYYSVATPLTELYFKTVMEQGQNVDALVTANTSERFNFSIAYKGLRSLGKYINQLSSTGNFRFTTSYFTSNNRYVINTHFTGQDLLNGENGGIVSLEDFESDNKDFKNRARLQVFLNDAKSFLRGKRLFIDHSFRINTKDANNNLYINHQFNLENKFFEFNQATVASIVENVPFYRFGNSYVVSNINDQTRYQRLYNKLGATYENKSLGQFQFFVEDFKYVYKYDKVLILEDGIIPNQLSERINALGGQYSYQKNDWKGKFLVSKAISDQTFSTIDANVNYKLNDKNNFSFQYQNISRIPNHNFILHQSSYENYNWKNDFKNEKINKIEITANTQWLNASAEFTTLNDYLYFSDDDTSYNVQLVSPKQYDNSISYLAFKVSKEIRYKKFALDNTILYQNVSQEDDIVNVPQIVTRNTLYFTDYFFKKALYLQTGVTLNYFSKYYMEDYSPVLGEFFTQNSVKNGNFPMLDFFVNARIRQTRIFLKAEHFNSSFTGNKFYSAPNTPYRDFMVRFGLVWNFFQ